MKSVDKRVVVLSRAGILEPLCFFEIVATWIHRVGGLGCLNNGVTDEAFESRLVCACFVLDGGAGHFSATALYRGVSLFLGSINKTRLVPSFQIQIIY